MNLGPDLAHTAHTAGLLMNIGKLLVPESLLTREGELSEAEREQVHQALQADADLLDQMEFGGPVVETLRQVLRRPDEERDPTRPETLLTAQILRVANAFVAMVSTRADRPSLPAEAALTELTQAGDERYDTAIIAALRRYLYSEDGRAHWHCSPTLDGGGAKQAGEAAVQ